MLFRSKQGGSSEQWTYLPEQFGNGWLCFESDVSKRRLTPVPPRWIDYSDKELVRLLDKAEPVVRPRASENDTPSTALTRPNGVTNDVRRSRTSSSALSSCSAGGRRLVIRCRPLVR